MKKFLSTFLASLIFVAIASASSIHLAWQVPINPTLPIVNYKIYRTLVSGGPYTLMGSTTGLTFVNGSNPDRTPLVAGQTYCYVVTAVYQNGATTVEGNPSNESCSMIPVPPQAQPAPQNLTTVPQS